MTLTAIGATGSLTATARTASGTVVPDVTFQWTSSATQVASVDALGTVTARGRGAATVLARAHGVIGSADVTVQQQVATLTVTPSSSVVSGTGAVLNVEAAAFDGGGSPMPLPPVTWSTTNADVASVTPLALTTAAVATYRDGQVVVSAHAGGVVGHANLTVVSLSPGPVRTWINGGTTPRTLNGLWGSGTDDVWAVGSAGTIRHYDGVRWSDASPGLTNATLWGIWGTGPDDVWVLGSGVTLHFDGSDWSTVPIPDDQRALWDAWGAAPSAVWGVCSSCPPHLFDGSAWVPSGPDLRLTKAWGSAPDDVWASGFGGIVARFDGSEWSSQQLVSPATNLRGIWGSSGESVWAVGDMGSIHRFDGDSWIDLAGAPFGTTRLEGVWGSGPNDVYVIGGNSVYQFDGSSWRQATPVDFGDRLFDVWGTGDGDVWAVGSGVITRGVVGPIAELTSISLASTTIRIGSAVAYDATVTNLVGGTVFPVLLQSTIEQASAERAGGGTAVSCGLPADAGDLPPGPCTFGFSLGASNSGAGSGTLVSGPATARFDLLLEGDVLDTALLPITLVN